MLVDHTTSSSLLYTIHSHITTLGQHKLPPSPCTHSQAKHILDITSVIIDHTQVQKFPLHVHMYGCFYFHIYVHVLPQQINEWTHRYTCTFLYLTSLTANGPPCTEHITQPHTHLSSVCSSVAHSMDDHPVRSSHVYPPAYLPKNHMTVIFIVHMYTC